MSTLLDSYADSNRDTDGGFDNKDGQGQTFTTPNDGVSYTLTSVKFFLAKVGSPIGNMVARLYAHTGTYGTDGHPTGSALASSATIAAPTNSSFPLFSDVEFIFSDAYSMSPNTQYCIVVEFPHNVTNYITMGGDSSSPTHGGNRCTLISGSWSGSASLDMCFYVYGNNLAVNVTVTPSAPAATFSIQTRTVSGGASFGASPLSAALSIPAITVLIPDTTQTPNVLALAFSTSAVSLVTENTLEVSPLGAAFSLPAPAVSIEAHLTPSPLSLLFAMRTPAHIGGRWTNQERSSAAAFDNQSRPSTTWENNERNSTAWQNDERAPR